MTSVNEALNQAATCIASASGVALLCSFAERAVNVWVSRTLAAFPAEHIPKQLTLEHNAFLERGLRGSRLWLYTALGIAVVAAMLQVAAFG